MNTLKLKPLSLVAVLLLMLAGTMHAQQKPGIDTQTLYKLHMILRAAHYDLQQHYYDQRYHGVNIDLLYQKVDARLDQATSLNEGYLLVAAYLEALNDSHTFFDPPRRSYRSDSGFEFSMIGDKCFVTHVRPGTDAAKKLHPGDQILGYDGYKVERSTFEAMHYNLALLATAQSSALYLQAPDGSLRNEIVQHKIIKTARLRDYTDDQEMNYWNDIRKDEQEEKLMEPKLAEVGDVIVWRQPEFDLTDTKIDSIIAHHVAGHKALVLDLRGNPGGWRDTLKYMIGPLIDHDVTVATLEARKPEKPLIAKTVKGHVYGGQVFVLVDSESASAAELFARVIQLEHRGKVLGDRTAGAVMLAREYDEALGVDTVTPYGFSITFANLLMADGKSLEHVGVVPDERVLPTASDMAADRDPVLAQAITEAGTPITPEAAAKLIPYKWAQIDED